MKLLKLFLLVFVFASINVKAQVDYPTQPKAGYYDSLKKRIMPIVPSEQAMIKAKKEKIPAGLKDTLLKYDWYEIASYYFFDKQYSTYWPKDIVERETKYANQQFNFFRYTSASIRYDMSLQRYKAGDIKVQTTTFNEATAVKFVEIKSIPQKAGTKNMLVTEIYGEKDPQEILSYKNGILIMSIKQSPNTTTKKFHIAYLAVPKEF